MKLLAVILAFATLAIISNCSSQKSTLGDIGSPGTSSSGSGTPTPTPGSSATPPGANTAATLPFEVILDSQSDTGGNFTQEIDCQVPSGTAVGSTISCPVAIPEGRLFFSALSWVVNVGAGTNANGCTVVVYQPYYYQASNAAGFFPPWETAAVDCSTSPIASDCFSGVAVSIVPSFPQFRSVYFNVAEQNTATYTAPSSRSMNRATDRWTVNNLAAGSRGANIAFTEGDAYLGSAGTTYFDYSFVCSDAFMQPVYTITMPITKVDVSGQVNTPANRSTNQFPDWDPASWDR